MIAGSHKSTYKLVQRQIEQGRRAYVVYPLIDESETLSAKAATKKAEYLQNEVFPPIQNRTASRET